MADTLPNISVDETAYSDIYSLTSITVGTGVVVQNKGPSEILLAISATEPNKADRVGVVVPVYSYVNVSAGENGLWAISSGSKCKLAVQVA